jgi:Asp-tRNA(Asn)/Glu-tRNA(Gln) amidotransferase A subunit family amidase
MKQAMIFTLALLLQTAGSRTFAPEEATIRDIHQAFTAKRITCVQLVQSYLDRIEAYDDRGPALNAIITINPKALETAAEMDRLYASGKSNMRPLH